MKNIALSGKRGNGKFALVDDEDFEELNKWKWNLNDSGYAYRKEHIYIGKGNYGQRYLSMHRFLNKTPDGLLTDHINRNKLDNRKNNLRSVTKSLNEINTVKRVTNTSGHRGVWWHKQAKKWSVEIKKDYKKIHIGLFVNFEDAVEAYKQKCLELFGEYCN